MFYDLNNNWHPEVYKKLAIFTENIIKLSQKYTKSYFEWLKKIK